MAVRHEEGFSAVDGGIWEGERSPSPATIGVRRTVHAGPNTCGPPGYSPSAYPSPELRARVAEIFRGRRVALAQEWLSREPAGSEKVFQAICRLFDDVPTDVYVLFDERHHRDRADPVVSATSFLHRSPLNRLGKTAGLPLMPLAWRTMGRGRFDFAIISSHALATSFARRADRSLVYCHTPPRYLWLPSIDPRRTGCHIEAARSLLRRLDAGHAGLPTSYLANSNEVGDRIRRFYERDYDVVAPPIDVTYFRPPPRPGSKRAGLLSAGRFVAYKRHDLAIHLAEAVGRPLTIAGNGPELARLGALAAKATVPVDIVTHPTDDELRRLYQTSEVLVMGAREDFGMVPIEAMACGTPVLAYGKGGAVDYVSEETGVLVPEQTPSAFAEAYRRLRQVAPDPEVIRESASCFGYPRFYELIVEHLERLVG